MKIQPITNMQIQTGGMSRREQTDDEAAEAKKQKAADDVKTNPSNEGYHSRGDVVRITGSEKSTIDITA